MNLGYTLATDVPEYKLSHHKEDKLWILCIGPKIHYIRVTPVGKGKYYTYAGSKYYKRLRDCLFSILHKEMQPF